MTKTTDKIDIKEAFQQYAKRELEFYKSAKPDTLYDRVIPNFKEKDKGSIDFYYNGIKIGGYIYKKVITLNKLKVTQFGKEEDIPEAIRVVEERIKEAGMTCDNQLK